MSPTMTEGGIASWSKQPGEAFSVGDILLEIETDKATMDVEAQDDGIMGKIILENGTKNIPVGKIIAMLAEEGDDISSIEVPAEEESTPVPSKSESKPESTSSSSPPPSSSSESSSPPAQEQKSQSSHSGPIQHSGPRPLFPSVSRLLHSHSVSSTEGIKGTGMHGMITKGDVLAHLGLIKTPWGSAEKVEINALGEKKGSTGAGKTVGGEAKKEEGGPKKVYDAATVRGLILSGLSKAGQPKAASAPAVSFDDILSDYLSAQAPPAPKQATLIIPPPVKLGPSAYFDGLL